MKFYVALVVWLSSAFVYSYPQVAIVKNSPIVVFDNKKQAVLKKDLFLKSPFAVVTASRDQLEFKINIVDKVLVYEKSKVQILDFVDETGYVSDLFILDGQIRFTATHRSVDKAKEQPIHLRTPFFDLKIKEVSDFIVNLNMKDPSVEIKMISGALPVEFFAYEKQLTLRAGESVKFVGESDDDKVGIKYDFLLNKKKAPRGAIREVQKFDVSSFIEAEKKANQSEINKKKSARAKEEEKKRKQKEYEDSFLCKKPFGNKDQCVWWVESGKCFRKRCNVSGQWGDQTERPMSTLCKNDHNVAECDY
ncbi:hypothetical protein K2P97_03565 [bacterium]|nr:hypothetical protein [bacterium]